MSLRKTFLIKDIHGQQLDAESLGQIAGEATDEIFNQFGLMNRGDADKLWADMNYEIQQALYGIVHKHVEGTSLPKFGEED